MPPPEYAERFVKFIRANIKTREEVRREKEREQSPVPAPLTTIEEQEDQRIMEKAHEQLCKERLMHEEFDVGRTTTMSPTEEHPDQIVPNVTVESSNYDPSSMDTDTVTSSLTEQPKQLVEILRGGSERHEDGGLFRSIRV